MTDIYRVRMTSGYRWKFCANLAAASAPLQLLDEDGQPVGTQYQTADARHDAEQAAELLWPIERSEPDDGDEVATVAWVGRMVRMKINVYRSGGAWYGARWCDGEWDGCDALDIPDDATEREAIEAAREAWGDGRDCEVERVEDV